MCEFIRNLVCANYADMMNKLKADESVIAQLKATNSNLSLANSNLEKELNELKNPNQNELYWNSKYPTSVIKYDSWWSGVQVDVRWFFFNDLIDEFKLIVSPVLGGTNDEKMLFCQNWVKNNIIYDTDTNTYKVGEYWASPIETLAKRRGDCEDGAILMANLAVSAGVPYWRVRLTAGDVQGGGHCYLTYLSDSQLTKPFIEQNWKVCDWCYYPDITPFDSRPNYKDEPMYFTNQIWFSFNQKYAFSTQGTTIGKNYIIHA